MSRVGRFLVFVSISALAWCVFVPLYAKLFSWTEYMSGINWIYLPHGLRMMLVLLFGVAGAIGFSIGAQVLRWLNLDGLAFDPVLHLPLAFVPGIAAYVAAWLTVKNWPGRKLMLGIGEGVPAIDGRRLILLALASAVLNSGGHVMVRLIFQGEAQHLDLQFLTMFIGDVLGAILLLYTLKTIILFIERRNPGGDEHVDEKTTQGTRRSLFTVSVDAERTQRPPVG